MNAPLPPSSPPRRVRILHLEDNLLDQQLVAAMLAGNDILCDFIYADNGDTFLSALQVEQNDLIISDFSLPGYDGARALDAARQFQGGVPFIFFSGTLGEEAAIESLKNGATDYVLKQRPERLVVAVRRALVEAETRAARQRVEEELDRRDVLFRSIMENVEDLVTVVAPDGAVTFSSPSHRRIFGADAPAIGSDFFLHTHPDDRPQIRAAFDRTLREGLSTRVEYRLNLPDEGVRVIEAQGQRDAGWKRADAIRALGGAGRHRTSDGREPDFGTSRPAR